MCSRHTVTYTLKGEKMRQWLIEPKVLCSKHLLGEHSEHHMFVGSIKKKISMDGYITNNLLQPLSLEERHEEIVIEMVRRGYKHRSNLDFKLSDLDYLQKEKMYWVIDKSASYEEIIRRCPICRLRYLELYWGSKYKTIISGIDILHNYTQEIVKLFYPQIGESKVKLLYIDNDLIKLENADQVLLINTDMVLEECKKHNIQLVDSEKGSPLLYNFESNNMIFVAKYKIVSLLSSLAQFDNN